jgi:Fe-S-cluster containining protein
MISFPCNQCGLCCQNLQNALEWDAPEYLQKAIADFPYKTLPDGSCEKLVDNQCSVYEDRPLLCNLDRSHDELDIPMSKQEWFDKNTQGCNVLKSERRNRLNVEIRSALSGGI